MFDRALISVSKIHVTLNTAVQNPDIREYHGFWETSWTLRDILKMGGHRVHGDFQWISGDNGHPFRRATTVLGVRYRMPYEFNPELYLQWFQGYGEVILDYNRRSDMFRFGLAMTY